MNDTRTMNHRHQCPGPGVSGAGCTRQVAADKLMCPPDWRRVPKPLQNRVWAAWRNGEGAGSAEHARAIHDAVEGAWGRG